MGLWFVAEILSDIEIKHCGEEITIKKGEYPVTGLVWEGHPQFSLDKVRSINIGVGDRELQNIALDNPAITLRAKLDRRREGD